MTTRTAAEALEKLIRLERDLEKKCHDLGYYNMIHVGLREFVEHAETFRAALAPPPDGEVEECAKAMDNLALKWPMRVDASLMQRAARLLRATQSAAPPPDEARELLTEVVRRYDDYRGKGVMPAPGEYQMVVGAIERIRAYLEKHK